MSKKDSTSQLERFVGAITINSDGSSNLTAELCQQIEDVLSSALGDMHWELKQVIFCTWTHSDLLKKISMKMRD
jgi:hypothetical protein